MISLWHWVFHPDRFSINRNHHGWILKPLWIALRKKHSEVLKSTGKPTTYEYKLNTHFNRTQWSFNETNVCFIKGILGFKEKYILEHVCLWLTYALSFFSLPRWLLPHPSLEIWKSRPQKSLQKPSCDITSISMIIFHYSSTVYRLALSLFPSLTLSTDHRMSYRD